MSDSANLSNIGIGATQWQAQWQAAQAGRLEGQLKAAAGAVDKVKAQSEKPGATGEAEKASQTKRLEKVTKDFESIFLAYMLKTMRQAVPKSDLLGQSQAHDIFTEMRDEELAKGMAQAGGIGLSKLMVEQLKRQLGK